MKKLTVFLLLLGQVSSLAFAKRMHKEKIYQAEWIKRYGGQSEYVLDCGSRVDVLDSKHAIEIDFADKWHEGIGQSLYYALKTGKKAGLVLIIEDEKDLKFYKRAKLVTEKHNIDLWRIKNEFVE